MATITKVDHALPLDPKNGYTLFSHSLRQRLDFSQLTFSKMVAMTAAKWQTLLDEEQESWTARAMTLNDALNRRETGYLEPSEPFFVLKDYHDLDPKNDIASDPGRVETPRSLNPTARAVAQKTDSPLTNQGCDDAYSNLYPTIETWWNRTSLEHTVVAPVSLGQIRLDVLDLRTTQKPTDLRHLVMDIQDEISAESKFPRWYLHTFLEQVNVRYYLIDTANAIRQLETAASTGPFLTEYLPPSLLFCIAIGCQIVFPSSHAVATAWYLKGLDALEHCEWRITASLTQSLALIGLFHVNQRPATAHYFLEIAVRVSMLENPLNIEKCSSDMDYVPKDHIEMVVRTVERLYLCLNRAMKTP